MYRRIVVPIDGSAASSTGLTHALGLAKEQQARVRVLHVVDDRVLLPVMGPYGAPPNLGDVLDTMREEGKAALEGAAALAARKGVKADTALVEGRGRAVSDVILEEVKRSRADLIVMGTHGRRGFDRLLLGSDAERVLRDSAVPVLLVRGAKGARKPAARRKRAPARRKTAK